MTRPDLLEQAVAEAEKKQEHEATARGATERQEEPLQHFDIVRMPDWCTADLQSMITIANQNDILISETVLQRWMREYARSDFDVKQLMVVRPKSERANWDAVLEELRRDGLYGASVGELLSYDWSPNEPTEVLWAPGITISEGPFRFAPYRMARPGGGTALGNGNTADPTQPVTRRHTILVEPSQEALARIQKSNLNASA